MDTLGITVCISILIVLAAAALFAVYMFAYSRRAAAALTERTQGSVKMLPMPPPAIVLAVLAALTAAALTAYLFHDYVTVNGVGDSSSCIGEGGGVSVNEPRLLDRSPDELSGTLLGSYSAGEDIPGYTMSEVTLDDIRLVYYTDMSGTGFFPAVLICADYTGAEELIYSDCTCLIDQTDWNGKTYELGGQIHEQNTVWYMADSVIRAGELTFTYRVYTETAEHTAQIKTALDPEPKSSSSAAE